MHTKLCQECIMRVRGLIMHSYNCISMVVRKYWQVHKFQNSWLYHNQCWCSYEYPLSSCKQGYHQQEHDPSYLILLNKHKLLYLTATYRWGFVSDTYIDQNTSFIHWCHERYWLPFIYACVSLATHLLSTVCVVLYCVYYCMLSVWFMYYTCDVNPRTMWAWHMCRLLNVNQCAKYLSAHTYTNRLLYCFSTCIPRHTSYSI